MRRDGGGFTLIEVLVALTLSGIALSIATAVFNTTSGSLTALEGASAQHTRIMVGTVWWAESLLSVRSSGGSVGPVFVGGDRRMRFRTWNLTPRGWTEAGVVTVEMEAGRLVAEHEAGEILLTDSLLEARFDYLSGRGGDAAWLPSWVASGGIPSAIRVRWRRARGETWDTLLFVVGAAP